jgi:hypothetical protein
MSVKTLLKRQHSVPHTARSQVNMIRTKNYPVAMFTFHFVMRVPVANAAVPWAGFGVAVALSRLAAAARCMFYLRGLT